MVSSAYNGSLFTNDFVESSVASLHDWQSLPDAELNALRTTITGIFTRFPTHQTPNEATTENDLIWPILRALGWEQFLTQQNLTASGRQDVPDAVLFVDEATKGRANARPEEWRRYEFGAALVESKRWLRPLDRRSEKRDEVTAPSTQMLRYLRRVDDLTNGNLRWGVLTNGLRWRLYYSGAQSIAEDFFEIDLGSVLGLPGFDAGLFALPAAERDHWFKVFVLAFRRQAFIAGADQRTFHDRALAEGKFYEERVAKDLSDLVFGFVFPALAKGIAEAAPHADLQEVREAALILLYRLLFILYAEDRDLLPVREPRYDDYSLREKVRLDVKRRKDAGDTFSATAARYWGTLDDLCRAIDAGDASIGLPPYNGGLFSRDRTPLLAGIRLGDALMANVIDVLSFIQSDGQRHYINYRDLSVQQLGSIYERLLEHEVVREDGEVLVRPNIFARKGSGSYYTPDDLVGLILEETLQPLVSRHTDAFRTHAKLLGSQSAGANRRGSLTRLDPALKLLELKVCDPAMGSGHFLVSLVDKLADHVIEAMAEAEVVVEWGDYHSPLADRIEAIRNIILDNAEKGGWSVNEDQLDDRHIIRRMVLKRCVYGVDKNPMAVELAKVALWLHTFTVGAPLSFLDHHLRAGDSLFGEWVVQGLKQASRWGNPIWIAEPLTRALRAASKMQIIEGLTDAEIAEAHRSADVFADVQDMTEPLGAILSLTEALEWLNVRNRDDTSIIQGLFDGKFGELSDVASGKEPLKVQKAPGLTAINYTKLETQLQRAKQLLAEAHTITAEERFLHWQVAFPGVWSSWEQDELTGGFDAIVGNPPWDRMKLQQVEWFAARRREIALAQRAADRGRMIKTLVDTGDPLSADYDKASARAETAARLARTGGDYPMLSGGDINLYSLFVERAMTLVKPDGMVGLLTPSGIASDKTASEFFKGVATEGRLKALYDFENRRTRYGLEPFFPDVDSRFKFCAFIASPLAADAPAQCAFFLQDVSELRDPDRCFPLSADDFAKVNPNTGTAPVFRTRRDADLTMRMYADLPVLVDRSGKGPVKAWPVRYTTMFHMTNDSHLFRTQLELEGKDGAYPIGQNRYRSAAGDWAPLYVGRMIHVYDHRAASVRVNEANLHNAALSGDVTVAEKADPDFLTTPQYWVPDREIRLPIGTNWVIAFRDIARATDARTMIAAAAPRSAYGNKAPLVLFDDRAAQCRGGPLLLANLNSVPFDYATRSKVHSTSLNWYIVEQLPVIPSDKYDATSFGTKSARDIVTEAVLELTYTAHDMAPFATDLGYLNEDGSVKQPFVWDEERRLRLRAKLDAVYFHLYGITDRDDVRYIYSTFPIVEREEIAAWGTYRSRDLCLHYMNALAAGHPDAIVQG